MLVNWPEEAVPVAQISCMMSPMTRDWGRLAAAIASARRNRGWSQKDLANAAGVGRSTVQNLEGVGSHSYSRLPTSAGRIETALGWPIGAMNAILAGEEVPPQAGPAETSEAEAVAGQPQFARGMPLRIARELSTGDVVDTVVLDLSDEARGIKLVGVLKTDDAASIEDAAAFAEALEQWVLAQRKMRGLPTGDPEE